MADKPNPIDVHAVVIMGEKGIERIIPDEFDAKEGTTVQWMIKDPDKIRINFRGDTPLEWDDETSDSPHEKMTGTVRQNTAREAPYKYYVSDGQGNTIDPKIRVRR
jgi:plastocyanin